MTNRTRTFLLLCLLLPLLFLGGCVQPPICGNGMCDAKQGENLQNCPRDCNTHSECQNQACVKVSGAGANECTVDVHCQVPSQPIPPQGVCGDERCNIDQGENLQNCPHDCQPACGNGVIDGEEECEIEIFDGKSCSSLGFDAGALKCTGQCTFNTEGCFYLSADYCEKMIENGAPENKVDIALVPSGYSDMGMWALDVALLVDAEGVSDGLFSVEPMKSNKGKFNVWKLNLKNTKFYDIEKMASWDMYDREAILDVSRRCAGGDIDMFFVVANNSEYSSTSGGFGAYPDALMIRRESGNADNRRISTRELVHEFGHGFANLADEYLNSQNVQDFSGRPNADIEGCPKWCSGQLNQNAPCYDEYAAFKQCLYRVTENLTKLYPQNEPCGFPTIECDLGVGCGEGTGCYWNAKSLISFKSSLQSIMLSQEQNPFEFNKISQEAILSRINELTAQNN